MIEYNRVNWLLLAGIRVGWVPRDKTPRMWLDKHQAQTHAEIPRSTLLAGPFTEWQLIRFSITWTLLVV